MPVMNDPPIELWRGSLCLSTDRKRIDLPTVFNLLRTAHWASALDPEVLARAIDNSVCFAVFDGKTLVAFGRAVTDLATYAYWTDVLVAEAYRRRGIGRWLADTMLAHPQLQGLRRVTLLTRDATALYEQVGFTLGSGSLTYMEYGGHKISSGGPAA
ncbi:MAG: GNAT family N-acetyltransferase [Gemmatimonadetes bacterium]|nr:MAG: GNAT family N-acetyltransferase [Gemmatimonadota bacterium]